MTPAMMLNLLVLVMAIVAITLASIAYANRNPTVTCSCPAPAAMVGASASANGVSGLVTQPLAGDEAKYLAGSGLWTGLPASSSVMVGASALVDGVSGLVPQPLLGDEFKYLAGDGTWKVRELGYIGLNDVTLAGGIVSVPNNSTTAIPMTTSYEVGYPPHPSFDSNLTTGEFDILVSGRYRVNAQIRMDNTVAPQNDYELSLVLSTGGDYSLSSTQWALPPLGAVSGAATLDLAAGTSVSCRMFQSNSLLGPLNALGVVYGIPPNVSFYSYMQIERLQ